VPRWLARALAVVGVVALGWCADPSGASPVGERVLFRFRDVRIDEVSGIAAGLRSPGIVYVQNDSGDRNRFFAVDAASGRTAATVTVRGATNDDWEDLAVAPDRRGVPSVWLADSGDNDADRSEIRLYRVDEPLVRPVDRRAARPARDTAPADVWRLRYPEGPADAESLAVAPGGTAYLITKSVFGFSVVYRVPPAPDRSRVQTVTRVGSILFRPRGVTTPFGSLGERTATGAAFSPDGRLFAVRTYGEAYVWTVSDGDVAAAIRRPPVFVALPPQPQGEGIALPGNGTALVDSEGVRSAVWTVPLPPALERSAPAPGASAAASTAASGGRSAGAADGGSPTARPGVDPAPAANPRPPTGRSSADHPAYLWPAGVAGLAAGVVALGLVARRRRRGRIRACRSPQPTPPSP
jgi:hypothetical protein